LNNNQDFSKAKWRGGAAPENRSEARARVRNGKPPAPASTADLRRLWRAHHLAFARACEDLEREAGAMAVLGDPGPPTVKPPPFPEALRGLRCGARTRRGTPCKRGDLFLSGRCALHGGKSTGPTTDEGRARARANLALRWAARKPMA
jgi:hypothetical protein